MNAIENFAKLAGGVGKNVFFEVLPCGTLSTFLSQKGNQTCGATFKIIDAQKIFKTLKKKSKLVKN